MKAFAFCTAAVAALLLSGLAHAQVPQLINYQGRVAVSVAPGTAPVNFDSVTAGHPGQFKFALVNGTGDTAYWSNDTSLSLTPGALTPTSQPATAVALTVVQGLYSVLLGDATLTNMTIVPATVFTNPDVRLRVWFNDGPHGSQLLTPDQRIAAVGYAMMAGNAAVAQTVPDGAITSAKIFAGAVGNAQLGANAVQTGNLADKAVGTAQLAIGAVQTANIAAGAVTSAQLATNAVTGDGWKAMTASGAPAQRHDYAMVWTGTEMIVWGGNDNSGPLNNGARYNPVTNIWTPLPATVAPPASYSTAVWTGSEMIVWGGDGGYPWSHGARYNLGTNTWTPMTTAGAPAARYQHETVWTGSEMIVWGGFGDSGPLNDGGRYNPGTDTWTTVATAGAPAVREGYTMVWAGSEMIVWGGYGAISGSLLNDGGRYDPATESWTLVATAGAPAWRNSHTAIWTGSDMVVWGGYGTSGLLNDGGRYNPAGKIAPGAVGNGQLADSSVTAAKIAGGAVGSDQLAPNLTIAGTFTAGNGIFGDGSGLTGIPQLGAATQTFNGANIFNGTVTTLGGLIIQVLPANPQNPVTGQIWLISP